MKIGSKVAVLDDNIEGVVTKITANSVTIETKDGFTLHFAQSELVEIVNEDLKISFNSGQIIKEKEVSKPNYKNLERKSKKELPVPDFDLHIEKLVKNSKSLSNFDILTIQLETAKRHIEFAIKNRIPKIVLIHGVGEGVLKSELEYLLKRYDMISFQEANYQRYGSGATEVYFKQNYK